MGDLVLVPQKKYEELIRVHKKYNAFYEKLDRNLKKALDGYHRGKAVGPFSSVAEMKRSLEQ